MKIKCTSCGAFQNNIVGQSCEFCGNILVFQEENIIDRKINLAKAELAGLHLNSLSYKSRNINNIHEIISIHPDNEIEEVEYLYLQNNNIKSVLGISKFDLSVLNLSNNEITILDEIPTIKRDRMDEELALNLSHNKNLKYFDKNVIEKLNSYKYIRQCSINLCGCDNFDVACLAEIDYSAIMHCKGRSKSARFSFYVNSGTKIPAALLNKGFIVTNNVEFGFSLSLNKNEVFRGDSWDLNLKNVAPIDDIKISEKTNVEQKKGCFIATAAMGDYNHPIVMDLRLFRDNWLLKRNWGANFTNWYYTHGPKASVVIERSVVLKKLTFIFIVKPLQLVTKKLR